MAIINILHISDLHYNAKEEKQKGFIKVFLNDLKTNNLKELCRFVIFSGELVSEPTKENFKGVKKDFIEPLMDIL